MFRLFVIFFIFSFGLMAASEIKLYLEDENDSNGDGDCLPYFYVSKTGSNLQKVFYEDVIELPTSSSTAVNVYVPYAEVGDAAAAYTILDKNHIPAPTGGYLHTKLVLSNSEVEDLYLNVAVQDESDASKFRVVSITPVTVSNDTTEQINYLTISLKASDDGVCSHVNCTFSGTFKDYLLFIFFSKTDPLVFGEQIAESDYSGIYINLNLSNRVSDNAPTLQAPLVKGDGRLTAVFWGSAPSNHYKDIVFFYNAANAVNNTITDAIAAGGSVSSEYYFPVVDGKIKIANLVNGNTYHVAIGYLDKYKFSSKLSTSAQGTPEEIEAFLKKNACYFISAGFGREHFVIDYFKDFRDRVLLQSGWGKDFVKWYYRTAPQYAHYIYNSKILSFSVRTMSYILYFLMNYHLVILLLLLIAFIFVKYVPKKFTLR